jgi:hypothetical protein
MKTDIINLWNKALDLQRPSLSEFEKSLSVRTDILYVHAPDFLRVGRNFLVKLPIGRRKDALTPVQSIVLILRSRYLSNQASVKAEDLKGIKMFGIGLDHSAQKFLEDLQTTGRSGFMLTTETRGWSIQYGMAIRFSFAPYDVVAIDPVDSEMVAVEYFYTRSYEGIGKPVVEGEGVTP